MNQTISEPKKHIKIWLPDSVHEEGGIWIDAKVCDVTVVYENIVIEGNFPPDLDSTLESFKGYKIIEKQ